LVEPLHDRLADTAGLTITLRLGLGLMADGYSSIAPLTTSVLRHPEQQV
jgi:hypothetical protein